MKNYLKSFAYIASSFFVASIISGCGGSESCDSGTADDGVRRYSVGGGVYDGYINQNPKQIRYAQEEDDDYTQCQDANENSITLILNGSEELKIVLNEDDKNITTGLIQSYKFNTKLNDQTDYNVTIKSCAGAGLQTCAPASNTNGTINKADVKNANFICNWLL
jgi:hypothetical protein